MGATDSEQKKSITGEKFFFCFSLFLLVLYPYLFISRISTFKQTKYHLQQYIIHQHQHAIEVRMKLKKINDAAANKYGWGRSSGACVGK